MIHCECCNRDYKNIKSHYKTKKHQKNSELKGNLQMKSCFICKLNIKNNCEIKKCEQTYHKECIAQWEKISNNCPCCNKKSRASHSPSLSHVQHCFHVQNKEEHLSNSEVTELFNTSMSSVIAGINRDSAWEILEIKQVHFDTTEYQNNKNRYNQLDEKYLFHGTKNSTIPLIIKNGFKSRYNKMAAYGKGNYFATYSEHSAKYCDNTLIKKMFLCKVLTGELKQGRSNMRSKSNTKTFVDNMAHPLYYSVQDDYCVPTHVITIKARPGM